MKSEILIFVTFSALVCASEVDEVEQRKRGAGKPGSLNAIPTGIQKPDYNYNIYHSLSSQSSSSPYQSQNPFQPNQANQYYSSIQGHNEQPAYQSQQANIPQSPSQFTPLTFASNQGYQSKYQIVPSKSPNGNIQLAILQPSTFSSSVVPYHPIFSPNSVSHINPHQQIISPIPSQVHFSSSYQPLSLGGPYIGHPSGMMLFAQSSPSLYNNVLYPNPIQGFYSYYPSSSQAKYGVSSSPQASTEYEKLQGPITQALPKDDSDVGVQSSDYVTSDANTSYKNSYSSNRNSYKLN